MNKSNEEDKIKTQLRQQKRQIERTKRALNRKKNKLERHKKKMESEIKKLILNNQYLGAKMLAKEIVRINNQIKKITEFSFQLNTISFKISTFSSLNILNDVIEQVNNSINIINSKLDLGKLSNLSKTIFKENMNLNIKEDMINDILDNINEGNSDNEEEEKIYNNVLREVGFIIEDGFPNINKNDVKKKDDLIDDDKIDNMLKSLKKYFFIFEIGIIFYFIKLAFLKSLKFIILFLLL